MTEQGYDYAWGWKRTLPAALRAAGATFVIRYVGTTDKCITKAELTALQKASIAVGLVYETTGATYSGGRAAGVTDGAKARAAAESLGVPAGVPIFFAIDRDTSNYAEVRAYLAGAVSSSGAYAARLYAGAHVLDAIGGNGHWQTSAWSGGEISKHAGLYQYEYDLSVGGASMDKNRTLGTTLVLSAGWLTDGGVAPPPPPPPAHLPYPGQSHFVLGHADPAVAHVKAWLKAIRAPYHMDFSDNTYGSGVLANVKWFQQRQGWSGSNADGLIGPGTWDLLQKLAAAAK